jgi:parvulin-like peptidyl-prolyl isomerase
VASGLALRAGGILKRVVREPLLQFLALGLTLFGANALIHGADKRPTGEVVTISQGQVGQIIESYLLLAGHLPSKAELEALVDDYVTEEIDYREAVAMGLDAEDTIVRRRMRQKLEFLVEDADASNEPSEVDLQSLLGANADLYKLAERRAIRQVLLSSDKRGPSAKPDAEALLTKLKSGADPAKLGDGSMLPAAMPLATEQGAANLFGNEFAAAVFAHQGKGWFGPVGSPFGQHLVLVMDIEPGRPAKLDDVHDRLRSDWIEARRDRARDEFQARMRKRYQIRINWPEQYKGLPVTPNPQPRTKKAPPEVTE